MDTQHSGMSHQWVCLASSKTRQTRAYYQNEALTCTCQHGTMCMLYILLLLTTVQETGVLYLEYKCVHV